MSEQQPVVHTPYTAQELLDCGWVRRVRCAVLADGVAIFIGKDFTIDAQNINHPERNMPIMLPNGGTKLVNHDACMQVVAWITGEQPIPESSPSPS